MKKLITLFLAIAMVLSMLAACAPAGDNTDGTPAPGSSESKPAESDKGNETPAASGSENSSQGGEEELSEYEKIGIPEVNYNEAIIRIASWHSEQPEFYVSVDDANTGDPVLDSIYKKNLYTEQTLGIELEFTEVPGAGNQNEIISWCETVKNMQSDPATPVDILACYSRTAAYATINGLNQDLTVYDNLDLSKAWWPKNVQEEFSIGNKLFFITGDISTNVLFMMYCVFYNKTIADTHGLGDPVQMVKDRTWTMEAWQDMTSGLYEDIDGVAGKSAGAACKDI